MRAVAALAVAAAFALGLPGCGGDDSQATGPASFVPADALAYAEVVVGPDTPQREDIAALAERFAALPLLGASLDGEALIEQAVDKALLSDPATYAEHVEPWLGERAGFAITAPPEEPGGDPETVVAIESADDEAALAALETLNWNIESPPTHSVAGVEAIEWGGGPELAAVSDGYVLFASGPDALAAAIENRDGGEALDTGAAFAGLPGDAIARAYVDGSAVLTALEADPHLAHASAEELAAARLLFEDLGGDQVAAGLSATGDEVALELAVEELPAADSDVLATAPADSFAALGLADGAEATARALQIIEQAGTQFGGPDFDPGEVESGLGEALNVPIEEVLESDGPLAVFARGELPDAFVLGVDGAASSGGEATEGLPPGTLAESEEVAQATAALDGAGLLAFADLDPILESFVGGGSLLDIATGAGDPEKAALGFLAGKLAYLAAGTHEAQGRAILRIVLGLD